jgi:hypothetical protein
VPARFTATVEEYRRWLVAELERFERPVDLWVTTGAVPT